MANLPHGAMRIELIFYGETLSKQLAISTTAYSNDNTDHSVTDTLPTYASNSVHCMYIETALPPESTTLLNSLLSSLCSTTSYSCSITVKCYQQQLHHTL